MKKYLLSLALLGAASLLNAQNTMQVNTRKLGAPIQSTMYGIVFEDIKAARETLDRVREFIQNISPLTSLKAAKTWR